MGKMAIIFVILGGWIGGGTTVVFLVVFSDCIDSFDCTGADDFTSYFFIFFFNEEAAFYLVFLLDSPLKDLFFY